MSLIKVVFRGHNDCLLTDYNGKRFCFRKNIPVEVDEEVFKNIIQSHNVDAYDLQVYSEPPKVEEKPAGPVEAVKEAVKKIIPHKKKGRK